MGDGDGARTLRPRLPVHLHGHLGALQNQLERRVSSKKWISAITSFICFSDDSVLDAIWLPW